MVQTKSLRPKGFPKILVNDFFLIGYRVFVRFTHQAGKNLRGLYILKSETDKKKMEFFGNIFTRYNYTTTDIHQSSQNGITEINTQQIASNSIPIENNTADIIFLLSAIHEIRSHKEKIQFLKECHRVSKSNGKVIMVEHLRDFPNFLAFSVGFTHFFSRSVWKNAFKSAGFSSFQETKFTPFMSIFDCSP